MQPLRWAWCSGQSGLSDLYRIEANGRETEVDFVLGDR